MGVKLFAGSFVKQVYNHCVCMGCWQRTERAMICYSLFFWKSVHGFQYQTVNSLTGLPEWHWVETREHSKKATFCQESFCQEIHVTHIQHTVLLAGFGGIVFFFVVVVVFVLFCFVVVFFLFFFFFALFFLQIVWVPKSPTSSRSVWTTNCKTRHGKPSVVEIVYIE